MIVSTAGNDGVDINVIRHDYCGGTIVSIGTTSPVISVITCHQNTFKITGGTILELVAARSTPHPVFVHNARVLLEWRGSG